MAAINIGIPLSGSNSLPITLIQTSSPGDLIHTTDTNDHYINTWVNNTSLSPVTVTVLKGMAGNYVVDSVMKIPPQSIKIPLEPGILLTNLQEYRIFASVPNVIKVSGFVLKRSGE